MCKISYKFVTTVWISLFFVSTSLTCNAETPVGNASHEITLYVMPTMYPLDWNSPATLYKTMKRCYLKTIGLPDNYLLGHIAVQLNSPLLKKPVLMAQASRSVSEKTDLILKQKVGFGILGATLSGRIETEEELRYKMTVYTKRNKLAFVKYRISERAMRRIMAFIDKYQQKMTPKHAPCDFYGGAFWPRYENEGAGCSTFAFALLDLVNVLTPETESWKLDLKIPMSIIGGEVNNGKKVKVSTIKRTTSWYKGEGNYDEQYINYVVYDPSMIFDWIMKYKSTGYNGVSFVEEQGISGAVIDQTNAEFDANAPLFLPRPTPNKFIAAYYKKIGLSYPPTPVQ